MHDGGCVGVVSCSCCHGKLRQVVRLLQWDSTHHLDGGGVNPPNDRVCHSHGLDHGDASAELDMGGHGDHRLVWLGVHSELHVLEGGVRQGQVARGQAWGRGVVAVLHQGQVRDAGGTGAANCGSRHSLWYWLVLLLLLLLLCLGDGCAV